ncbi:MAG: 3'-5' exonuclease [Myxococcota bacterium]|nr:3'-5' exonuclease [Myxococcota bacterium]
MLSFDLQSPWRDLSLVAVDVETTGLDVSTARVIEVGIVRFEKGQIVDRWGSLINPGMQLPAKITEITKITDTMLEDKPSFRELKWEIYSRLRDRVFIAYNADYDWGILHHAMQRVGLTLPDIPILDPLVWARKLMPNERRHNLGSVTNKLGIDLENAHRAEDDAEAAGKVLMRFADKVPLELGALLEQQAQWKEQQEAALAQRRAERAARRAAVATPDTKPAAASPAAQDTTEQAGLFG